MTRDSQQSLEKSRSFMNRARLATAGLTLLTMVAAEEVMSSNYSQTTSAPEIASFIPNAENIIGFNPRTALANALECITRISLKIHAPKDDTSRPVEGVILQMWNETNPNQRINFVATSNQAFNADKKQYTVNTSAAGEAGNLLRGNSTGERDCDNPDQSKCKTNTNGRRVIKTTTLRGMQVNPDGTPVTGFVGTVTADCPSDILCDWSGAWADERTTVVPAAQPTPETRGPVCPGDTILDVTGPMPVCIKEVPVPTEQSGQAPR